MPILTQGKTNWKFIGIVIVLAIIAGFGMVYSQDWLFPNTDENAQMNKEGKLSSFEIVPSCLGQAGWIIYPSGAKAVATGENLSRVEFWVIPTGTDMQDTLYSWGEVVRQGDQWEAVLPDILFVTDFYAVGYDTEGNQVGKIALGDNVYGSDQSAMYPADCR